MVVYDQTFVFSDFDGTPCKINIPYGVYVFSIEIENHPSYWGHVFDIKINKKGITPVMENLNSGSIHISFANWISTGDDFEFTILPNDLMPKLSEHWMFTGESIEVRVQGYYVVPNVKADDNWDFESFSEEWA